MNIGIFTDTYYPQINGVTTSIMMLNKELTSMGHKVYIFTTSDPKAEKKQPNVFRLPSMPFVFLPSNRVALMYPPKLLVKMKKFKLDIIHTHTEFPLGIFGKIVSEFYKIPLVHTYHTMYEDYVHYIAKGHIISPKMAQRYSRIFCNRAKAVIAPVEKAKDKLISYGVKKPIYVIPTGIDFEPFSREKYTKDEIMGIKDELGLNQTDPVIISIGRIAKEKSIDVIIKAMPEILEKMPDLKFVIVGDGPYKTVLMDLAKELNVQDSIIFAGSRPWSDIGKYYQVGDIFVCASTSETQGLTYIEAMAAKVTPVVKRDPSVDGIIQDGVTGFYFDNDDEAAHMICHALSSETDLNRIVENGYKSIQHLSLDQFGKSLELVYLEVIENARVEGKNKKIKDKQNKKDEDNKDNSKPEQTKIKIKRASVKGFTKKLQELTKKQK